MTRQGSAAHRGSIREERGSAPVEFVLVGALLTVLTLAVMQLGLAVYVRNVVHDAAAEGAHRAALADTALAEGVARTGALIDRAIGDGFAEDISARLDHALGVESVAVTVRAPLPVLGLIGVSGGLEVTAHAPVEVLP